MELDAFQRDNRANWDDRATVHITSDDYGLQRYIGDPNFISDVIAFDAPLLGDVTGFDIAHLQCHIGTDTVSLARLGARSVLGLDFSERAIAAANDLAEATGAAATFAIGNVYDAPLLLDRTFDLVYTSVGAINWLADLDRWAGAVSGLLDQGGWFYIRDGHPSIWVLEEVDGEIRPTYDYANSPNRPFTWDEAVTYTDGDHSQITHTRTHEWNHSLPDVVNALVGAGMTIDRMAEHEGLDYQFVLSMVKEGPQWFLPEPWRGKFPTMFSLWATKR